MTTTTHQTAYVPQPYQLSARDRTGQLLGKSMAQLVVLGVAVALGVISATVRGPLIVGLPVAALLALLGVAPWKHQRPLVEQLGALAEYALTPKLCMPIQSRSARRSKIGALGCVKVSLRSRSGPLAW